MSKIRILSITAQKPFGTGSGVYLCEMVKAFEKMGHKQAVVFGGDCNESSECDHLPAKSHKVAFNNCELPFPVFGMSDNMPYESSRYCLMKEEERELFRASFEKVILEVDREFNPDIIICHHLYYLTAITANLLPYKKVVAICHGTCLRQMQSHFLEEAFIKENINKLYKIFSLQRVQVEKIKEIYDIKENKIVEIGTGYNDEKFYYNEKQESSKNKIVYGGKLSPSKGLEYLINAIEYLSTPVELFVAGDGNDEDFIKRLKLQAESVSGKTGSKISFVGRLNQDELGELFRKCEIFVLPSFYEGLPLVIIEAIACGLKIVFSKLDGSYQWFEDNFDNLTLTGINMAGSLNDDGKGELREDEFACNIARAIEDSRNLSYVSQNRILNRLKWTGLCDKIVNEINEK